MISKFFIIQGILVAGSIKGTNCIFNASANRNVQPVSLGSEWCLFKHKSVKYPSFFMRMKLPSLKNTLFLRDLAESNVLDGLFGAGYFDMAPPSVSGKANCYSPKLIRGTGVDREGYCERCDRWFRLKTSSYWYHMNYKHGISSKGVRCPEPIFRGANRTESYCGECRKWIHLGNKKRNPRFVWLRHWQKTHTKRALSLNWRLHTSIYLSIKQVLHS